MLTCFSFSIPYAILLWWQKMRDERRYVIAMVTQFTPVELFCSYAHEDEVWLRRLEVHLSLLKRQGLISLWHDRLISAGTDWTRAIDTHLETASIILLLVSADFFASDYCYGVEMKRALERQEAGEARVIPIVVRSVNWKDAPIAHLQMLPTDNNSITSWRDTDTALADVAVGIRRIIVEDLPLLQSSASRNSWPSIWNIPYRRNPFFLGRESELVQVHQRLQAGQTTALSQPQAISGLGGVGKTHIAIEYAYRHSQDYQAILWTRAETYEALVSGYVEIAQQLSLPLKDEKNQTLVVKAVIQWFKTHTHWLLILDNADELIIVRDFFPTKYDGHILLTTRAQSMGRLAQRLEVETMDRDIGALLLLRRAGLVARNASLDSVSPLDITLAREIAQEVDGLPLAIDQIGAYIEETRCSLFAYQSLYHTRRVDLLSIRGDLIGDHPEPVATTWSLSFQQVEEKNIVAAELLRLCAHLNPSAIPEEFITASAEYFSSYMRSLADDPFALNKAIATLNAYSLIRRDTANKMLSIHRLVQVMLRDTLPIEAKRQSIVRAIQAINKIWTSTDFAHWVICERYLPHVMSCATWIEQYNLAFSEATVLLSTAGYYLARRARYKEAESLLRLALHISKQLSRRGTYEIASCTRSLASLYRRLGRYEEAILFYQEAATIYKQVLGPEHLNTIQCLNGVARVLDAQGNYAEAEVLYRQVLAAREQQLGSDHADTITSSSNLAVLYLNQGKYELAEPLLLYALSMREQLLGAEHPYTSLSFSNLAMLYFNQGKYELAEPLYQQALTIREQQLGPDHPDTAKSLNNLARLYQVQGKYAEAEALYHRALRVWEQQVVPKHPELAETIHDLAAFQEMQGNHQEALALYQRALAIREQVLGPKHPKTRATHQRLIALRWLVSRESSASSQDDTPLEQSEQKS